MKLTNVTPRPASPSGRDGTVRDCCGYLGDPKGEWRGASEGGVNDETLRNGGDARRLNHSRSMRGNAATRGCRGRDPVGYLCLHPVEQWHLRVGTPLCGRYSV